MGNTGPGAARSGRCAAGGDVHSFLGVADDRGRLAHRFHRGHAYLAAGHVAGGAAGTGGADPGLTVVPADHLSIAILAVGTDDSACDRAANAIIAAMQTN